MASKKSKSKGDGFKLGSVPLGSALDAVDGVGSVILQLLSRRYQVEKKVDDIKKQTDKKVGEIRDEAVRTGYAVKKAFLRAVVEAIMLITGILSLVAGLILLIKRLAPIEYVLLGYGFLVTIFVALTVKLSPDDE
ncbi:MAG: hypothetical protein KKD39_02320 [Candidatus Altiarchaeota archaeon]|nr:hypothetical protein [Candidatus Altiarchaeota archaeon]